MNLKTFYFNPLRVSTYLIYDDEGTGALIDCGAYTEQEKRRLETFVADKGIRLTHYLLTHAHIDHLYGTAFVGKTYQVQPHLHPADEKLFRHAHEQADAFGMAYADDYFFDYHPLHHNEELSIGTMRLKVISTPGHTKGGVCYYAADEGILFSGDTLFQGSIGRTDLPFGDTREMKDSLQRLLTLPDETIVYPGHGLETTIGDEKQHNPYLKLNF